MKYHKIWRVTIVSRDDPGAVMARPVRAEYLIESRFKNGIVMLQKRALALAAEDGIPNPIVAGMEWINSPWRSPESLREDNDPADFWKRGTR